MQYENNGFSRGRSTSMALDEGLRAFMIKIYNYMALGLAATGATAYMVSNSPDLMETLFSSPLVWVVMLAPLGFVMALSFGVHKMRASTVQTLFWVYSVVMGLSLSTIFVLYTSTSIARVFFITSGTFAAMSLYGYTTKKDLSALGSFLFMGLIGIVLASIVNIFMGSSALSFAISILGVGIFTGLTAYDTQKIKEMYAHMGQEQDETTQKAVVMAALTLYLDFINIFVMLLRLMGDRRN